jgi:hypothetical protein
MGFSFNGVKWLLGYNYPWGTTINRDRTGENWAGKGNF